MINVKVCVGTSCHLKGSYNVVMTFQEMIEEHHLHDQVELQLAFCMGHCQQGVCVSIDEDLFSVTGETAMNFFKANILSRID
ncbi:MAG: NAD(P)H-dependent oxidoreductase subunit E [Clostridia bacterium]